MFACYCGYKSITYCLDKFKGSSGGCYYTVGNTSPDSGTAGTSVTFLPENDLSFQTSVIIKPYSVEHLSFVSRSVAMSYVSKSTTLKSKHTQIYKYGDLGSSCIKKSELIG